MTDSTAQPGGARIIDQGYRRYDGARRGPRGATVAVYKAAMQRALGLKRGARFKVVPVATAVLAYLPAVVFVGAVSLLPTRFRDEISPDYADYYSFVTAAIVLFVAFVAPEVLCTDRRTGMLGLYLAGPLDRARYLLAKAAAVATVLAVVTLGPLLLMLVGYSLADIGPGSFLETLEILARIVVAAAVVTLWYTALSLALSSLTDRRAFAAASIILSLLVSSSVVTALVQGGELTPWLRLFDLFILPFEVVRRVYGVRGTEDLGELSTAPLVGAAMVWSLLFVVVLAWRYRRLEVTR